MDLLDRVNALTDDQLRMIADRDDASGVLASYVLAERRGLPMPDRETAIVGDGYVIVAQGGAIQKLPVDSVEKIIRQEEGRYCVYSEDGSQSFGCYDTMSEAEDRLRQIHFFRRAAIREGSFVSWNSSGGRARGQVEHVMYEGTLGVPGSEFQINAEPDDPAVLIRIWREYADGWRGTETLVGHKMSTLTRIDALSKADQDEVPTKRENGMDFPVEAYAYTPEPDEPATWMLRVWGTPELRETREQIGIASAAMGTTIRIPADKMPEAQQGLEEARERLRQREEREAGVEKQSYKPPKGVQESAQRALDWISEGHAGSGFTDVGRARAAQLARGQAVSEDTIRRMASYLARHQGDARAEGFNSGEQGFPSPGRVAWDAWGGDAAVSWTNRIVSGLDKQSCPPATQDIEINLENRQDAIDVADYGPLNPEQPGDFWESLAASWDVPVEEAQSSVCGNCAAFDITAAIKDCIADGIGEDSADDPFDVIDAGELGYCRAFKFKCAAARTCSAWIAGGPITDEDTVKSARFLRKEASQRFTLGPLYVPEFMDAHGEWTDADELQPAVWEWVKSGDRTVYLQHDREVRAGEWVEVMTMPQPWTVDMTDGSGKSVGQVTYPAGTVFLGVIWDEDAWEKVRAGELRGYSIGGFSDRVLADLPSEAVRDGIEVD